MTYSKQVINELLRMLFGSNAIFGALGVVALFLPKNIQDLVFAVLLFLYIITNNIILLSWSLIYCKKETASSSEPTQIVETKTTKMDILKKIASAIRSHGTEMPKKHGSWICLDFDGFFYSMDTYNGAIHYRVGMPQYDYWLGFTSTSDMYSEYLGLSNVAWLAGDDLPLSEFEYNKHYNRILAGLSNKEKS